MHYLGIHPVLLYRTMATTEYWMVRKRVEKACWRIVYYWKRWTGICFSRNQVRNSVAARARSIMPVLSVNASFRLENNLYVPPYLPTYVASVCFEYVLLPNTLACVEQLRSRDERPSLSGRIRWRDATRCDVRRSVQTFFNHALRPP